MLNLVIYLLAVTKYFIWPNAIIKAIPCLFLCLRAKFPLKIALLAAATGDYFLHDPGNLILGLVSFGICNWIVGHTIIVSKLNYSGAIILLPILGMLQTTLYDSFGSQFIYVDIYILSIIWLCNKSISSSNKKLQLATFLFLVSDVFVLLQYFQQANIISTNIDYSLIGLPLYWASMFIYFQGAQNS